MSALLGAHLAERALKGADARAIRVRRQGDTATFALGSHLERHGYTLLDEIELDGLRKGTDRLAAAELHNDGDDLGRLARLLREQIAVSELQAAGAPA